MNEGLKCLLLSCAVGAFLGWCGALLRVSAPSGHARRRADLVCSRLTVSWIRPLLRRPERARRRKTAVLRFLRDFLYPIGCAVVILIFLSHESDGEVRLYMLMPLAFFQWLSLRYLSGAAYMFCRVAATLAADICLTALWPLIRAGQYVGVRLLALREKILLSLRRKYDMMKKKRRRQKEAKEFARFREQIVKELKIWPRSSDASISPKSLGP